MITEENVVQQIKLKNEESLTFILKEYGGLLHAIIRKYINGDQQDFEEYLGDVLVSVWFHIHSFDPAKNDFKNWICAIAKYRAIDYLRKTENTRQHFGTLEINDRHDRLAYTKIIKTFLKQLTKSQHLLTMRMN